MKPALAVFAVVAFASLVGVSIWATGHVGIMTTIHDLQDHAGDGNNPWLVATLFDAYFGFLWFWLWVAYKETSWVPRILWLVLILLLGNMAMAAYVLLTLMRLPAGATPRDLLVTRRA